MDCESVNLSIGAGIAVAGVAFALMGMFACVVWLRFKAMTMGGE